MTLTTLCRYLFTGSPDAIRTIAATRGAIWVGLALVLSAGLAREYDGEYLPARAWVLAVPFAAALAMATILFVPTYFAMRPSASERRPPVGPAYRAFVSLFLLTAPLAWLYAIPYERFLSPAGATAANLWTLALVALWRVVLITRVLEVLTGRGSFSCLSAVMLVADVAVLIAISYAPQPLLDMMGGLRLSERERMVASATFLVQVGGVLSFPIWLGGAAYWLFAGRAGGSPMRLDALEPRRVGAGPIVLAAGALAIWAAVLPTTQREQRIKHEVETRFAAGRFSDAIAEMSRHDVRDFPPQWDPPPHVGWRGVRDEDLYDAMEAVLQEPRPPWVTQAYQEKFARFTHTYRLPWMLHNMDERVVQRLRGLLDRMPAGEPWDEAREAFTSWKEREEPPATTPTRVLVPATPPTTGPTSVPSPAGKTGR